MLARGNAEDRDSPQDDPRRLAVCLGTAGTVPPALVAPDALDSGPVTRDGSLAGDHFAAPDHGTGTHRFECQVPTLPR